MLAGSMLMSTVLVTGCTNKYISTKNDYKSLVVTIGKEEVYMDTLKPYITDTEITTEYYNQMYKGYNKEYDIWSEKDNEGKVNSVGLRDKVLEQFEEKYIVYKEASKSKKYDIPEKDLKKLKKNSKDLVATFSKDMIKKTGYKDDSFLEMQKMQYVYDKYKADVIKSFNVKADDVKKNYDFKNVYREYKTTQLYISTSNTDESGNTTNMTEAEKKEAKKTMEKALKMLKDGKSVKDITKKYPSITSEEKSYQQDEAYPAQVPNTEKKENSDSKTTDNDSEPDVYVEKTKKLKNGAHTDVFEYESKYVIAIMDNNKSKEAYDAAVKQGVADKEEEKFTDKINKLKN